MTAPDTYHTPNMLLKGLDSERIKLVVNDIYVSAASHGGYASGGFVDCDAAGLPLHLAGWKRTLYRMGAWLISIAAEAR